MSNENQSGKRLFNFPVKNIPILIFAGLKYRSRIALLFFSIIGIATNSAFAYTDSPELPDGPVTPLLKPLLAAVNSGDPEQINDFIKRNFTSDYLLEYPAKFLLQDFMDIHNIQGTLSFHSVRHYDRPPPPNELPVIFKTEKTEIWYGAIITVTEQKPHKISDIFLTPAKIPSNVPEPKSISLEQALVELDSYVNLMEEMGVFSGAVLLARLEVGKEAIMLPQNDKVLYTTVRGLASKRFNVANNLETKFNLGSMNKMFTALGVLQLVEKGKLSLDSTLSQYVDESWLPYDISEKIKIRHLLTHSSGLGNYFNRVFANESKNNFRILDDYKPLIVDEPLLFEPGTRNRYSNTGLLMAGVVIEAVSGLDYFQYIEEHIYQPAGMANSGSFEMDQPMVNLAIGYERNRRLATGWENNLYTHVLKGGPSGGGFSTVKDLYKFARALTRLELLGKELTDEALSAKPLLHSPNYGYGFGVRQTPKGMIVGHGGGFMGISSNLDIYLEQGYVSVVLSNYSRGSSLIENKIRELLSRVQD